MFAISEFSRSTRRVIVLLAAALIVTAGLLAWKHAGDSSADKGYSVTIEQLQ